MDESSSKWVGKSTWRRSFHPKLIFRESLCVEEVHAQVVVEQWRCFSDAAALVAIERHYGHRSPCREGGAHAEGYSLLGIPLRHVSPLPSLLIQGFADEVGTTHPPPPPLSSRSLALPPPSLPSLESRKQQLIQSEKQKKGHEKIQNERWWKAVWWWEEAFVRHCVWGY